MLYEIARNLAARIRSKSGAAVQLGARRESSERNGSLVCVVPKETRCTQRPFETRISLFVYSPVATEEDFASLFAITEAITHELQRRPFDEKMIVKYSLEGVEYAAPTTDTTHSAQSVISLTVHHAAQQEDIL